VISVGSYEGFVERKGTEMFFVMFLVNGRIVNTAHYDASPDAFSDAEDHADNADNDGNVFDAVVCEVVDGLPVHIRSY
jgi:hypothetical protein